MIDRSAAGVGRRPADLFRSVRALLVAIHPAFGNEAFWQLVRFAIGGFGVTLFAASIYSAAAVLLGIAPLAANAVSSLFGVIASYAVHSRWSFAADTSEGETAMIGRFLTAAGFAFALNSFWVWLLTGFLGLPPLSPVPAMIFVTPLASFLLNRYWVFKVA